jgi:hypothetical protein
MPQAIKEEVLSDLVLKLILKILLDVFENYERLNESSFGMIEVLKSILD